MGDRSNVQFGRNDQTEYINVYSHWGGKAFQRKALHILREVYPARINDPSYLTRYIVSNLLKDTSGDITGHGLWMYPDDNDHPILAFLWSANHSEFYIRYGDTTTKINSVYDIDDVIELVGH